ncbi:MAG: hypothetical protein JRF02_09180, partial [Deltaproteobacteria bacterium]|nr:hypothetical protein [Deltaproteobacteria bacterium]
MNSLSSHSDHKEIQATNISRMHFGNLKVHNGVIYTALAMLTVILFFMFSYLGVSYQVPLDFPDIPIMETPKPAVDGSKNGETADLIRKLKHFGLWKFSASADVPRF